MVRNTFITAAIINLILYAVPATAEDCPCRKSGKSTLQARESTQEQAEQPDSSTPRPQSDRPRLGRAADAPPAADANPAPAQAPQTTANSTSQPAGPRNNGAPPSDPPKTKSSQSSLATVREKSLRASAKHLGLDYDTMLGDLPDTEEPPVADESPDGTPDDGKGKTEVPDVDQKEAARQRRRARLKELARHVLGAATSPELQTMVTTLAPDPRVALAFGILNRVGTVARGRQAESASEGGLDEAHDLAKENPAEFAAALDDVLSAEQEEKQLQLLLAKQAAERELFLNQQAVARAEKGLQRARDAAAASQKELESAEKARN
jgi:hypothetical protein